MQDARIPHAGHYNRMNQGWHKQTKMRPHFRALLAFMLCLDGLATAFGMLGRRVGTGAALALGNDVEELDAVGLVGSPPPALS